MVKAFILLFLVMSLNFSQALSQQSKDNVEVETLAQEFVYCLSHKDFQAAVEYFDKVMKAAMPADNLAEIWQTTTIQLGQFKKQRNPDIKKFKERGLEIVFVLCEFERLNMNIRLIFNAGKQISSMSFIPQRPEE